MRYLIIILLLSACTPMTIEEREEREYRREEQAEAWLLYKESCVSNGGYVYVQSHGSLTHGGVPARGDRAYCVTKP